MPVGFIVKKMDIEILKHLDRVPFTTLKTTTETVTLRFRHQF